MLPGDQSQAAILLLPSLREAIVLLLQAVIPRPLHLLVQALAVTVPLLLQAAILHLLLQAVILHLLLQAVIPRPLQNQMRISQVAPLRVERNLPSISQKLTEAIDPLP